MAGIWGDGQRGGIFGAKVDPRLQAELERRAAAKRQEMADPSLADQWHGSLANRILSAPSKLFGGLVVDPAMDLATLAGDVIHGRQPTMAADPQTGEFHTDPGLINRTNNAAGMLTLGAGAVPAEANSLRMGIKAYRDIRPPKEDVWETVQGHANHGTVLGDADVDINKLSGGHRLSDPTTRKRVDALKAKIGGDDGYIERLIVDDTGNVIEGAHRLDALRELGAKNVPATLIRDLGRGVDTNKVEAAVKAAGQVRGEQSRQIVQNVLEMANDVGLDNIASQYTFPRGFEASHQAAIDALKGQTLETAEQVKARLAPRPGIRAYHGSPHDFERFDSSKIGTGEGAQAYGHGLYFGEREAVAQEYKKSLAQTVTVDGKPLLQNNKIVGTTGRKSVDDELVAHHGDLEAAISNLEAHVSTLTPGQAARGAADDLAALKALRGRVSTANTGHMYQVDIAADPEHFLDWDKPLSEQPEAVRKAYAQAVAGNDPLARELLDGSPESLQTAGLFPRSSGAQAYNTLAGRNLESTFRGNMPPPDYNSQAVASKSLREAGIPGIKYLDQGSRGAAMYDVGSPRADFGPYTPFRNRADAEKHLALLKRMGETDAEIKEIGKQTSNYVVFDDKLISILKKYGLPITAAGVATLSQLHPEEAKAAQKQKGR